MELRVALRMISRFVFPIWYVRFIGKQERFRKMRNVASVLGPLAVVTIWLWSANLLKAVRPIGRTIALSTVSLEIPDLARLMVVATLAVFMTLLWFTVAKAPE